MRVQGHEAAGLKSRCTELQLGALDELRVTIDVSPAPTLLSLLCTALSSPGHSVPDKLVQRVRRNIPAQTAETLSGVLNRRFLRLPNCVCGPGMDRPVRTQIEGIAETPPTVLVREVYELYGEKARLPEYWEVALRDPRRWLAAFATAMGAAWQVLAPVWRDTKVLRVRETERVGAAVVRGALDVLLASIDPRNVFADRTLYLPDTEPCRVRLDSRRIVLIPMMTRSAVSVFSLDEPDLVWFAYPVPGIEHLGDDGVRSLSPNSLKVLLGPIKARLLRVLTRPFTMGTLASELRLEPSTATYHCKQLVSAGLVARVQAGREVRVWRTPRGDALIDLLS